MRSAALDDQSQQTSPEDAAGVSTRWPRCERMDLAGPAAAPVPGGGGYAFRHALIRDAAYESLTKERRAELHERFARLDGGPPRCSPDEFEAILGYHLEQAYGYREELAPGPTSALATSHGRRRSTSTSAGRRAGRAREDAAAASLLDAGRAPCSRPALRAGAPACFR